MVSRKGVRAGSWLAKMLSREPLMLVIMALIIKRTACALRSKERDLLDFGNRRQAASVTHCRLRRKR